MRMRQVSTLPTFPENILGLRRGTILRAIHPEVAQLGLKVGDTMPIGFNGESVCFQRFTWNIDQLVSEVTSGIWEIAGQIDLSDRELSLDFAKTFELLEVVTMQ